MRVTCLAQNSTQSSRPGVDPGPLDQESSALNMRPPRLPMLECHGAISKFSVQTAFLNYDLFLYLLSLG